MEKRDLGVGLGGLLTGLALLGGLLYYTGGWKAFDPVTNKGSEMAEKVGIKMPIEGEAQPSPRGTETPRTAPSLPGASTSPNRGNGILRVKLNKLTMHRCPGYDCEKVATLPGGTKVVLLGDLDSTPGEVWCRVRVGTTEGWVSRYYLE